MQINKPELIFTFPAVMGGVASFNFNLINNSPLLKSFYSKVILLHEVEDNRPLFTETFKSDEQIVFKYSGKENQHHLQKRLNELIGNNDGAIITDNGLTIEAATRFSNPKTIFSLIHDYYYVKQQINLKTVPDVVIAHSSFFSDSIFASDPSRFAENVFCLPYGVKQLAKKPLKKVGSLNLVFLGRLETEKGVLQLIEIEEELQKLSVIVKWTIIGKGSLKDKLKRQWKNKSISFFEPYSTEEVYALLQEQDIFIFPTLFEGTPVAILECLANAVVTVTHDLPGGIRDILQEGIGYICKVNAIDEFVNCIVTLHNDRELLSTMQANCFELSQKTYDVKKNADRYFELFLQFTDLKRKKTSRKMPLGGVLDRPFIPNFLVKLLRYNRQ